MRRRACFMVVLSLLLASAAAAIEETSLEELSEMRKLWEGRGGPNYTARYSQTKMGWGPQSAPVEIRVEDGFVRVVTRLKVARSISNAEAPEPAVKYSTVLRLFEVIEESLELDFWVAVDYDPIMGYPAMISIKDRNDLHVSDSSGLRMHLSDVQLLPD